MADEQGHENIQSCKVRSQEDESSEHDTSITIINTDDEKQFLVPSNRTRGLNMYTAAMFLAGELAGTGVLTTPSALGRSGYFGIGLIFVTFALATYCGVLLGEAWEVAKTTRRERGHLRDPYPLIGEAACGKGGKYLVSLLLSINITMICLVYLTLTAEIASNLFSFHFKAIPVHQEGRLWLVLCTAVIVPFTWFGTPKDFWGIGVAALATTVLGATLILINLGLISSKLGYKHQQNSVNLVSFFSASGTFIFAFTGISLFPTVQTDMKDPAKFRPAVFLGSLMVLSIYFPVALYGYLVLGRDAKSNVLENLSMFNIHHGGSKVLTGTVSVLLCVHLLSAIVMYLNPLVQQLEIYFGIQNEFSWRRCLMRSGLMILILCMALIFPQFGPLLDLVGGFLKAILCFVFPLIFYYRLHPTMSTWHKVLWAIALVLSVVGCILSTYAAAKRIQLAWHEIYAR